MLSINVTPINLILKTDTYKQKNTPWMHWNGCRKGEREIKGATSCGPKITEYCEVRYAVNPRLKGSWSLQEAKQRQRWWKLHRVGYLCGSLTVPAQSLAPIEAQKVHLCSHHSVGCLRRGRSGPKSPRSWQKRWECAGPGDRQGKASAICRGRSPILFASPAWASQENETETTCRNCWSHSRLSLPGEACRSHVRQRGNWGRWPG